MLKSVAFSPSINLFQKWVAISGLKYFTPVLKEDSEKLERPKLRVVERSPQYPPNMRPLKIQKNLDFMRGPETLHNKLLHGKYGVIATSGGRLRWGHFEMIRLTIGRKMDINRMFAIWRVPAPWQPITKKGQGQRMGGGKGSIDHYVTPVKKGRIIMELAGKCEFVEVEPLLKLVCDQLPFNAKVISYEIIEELSVKKLFEESENINSYTVKYIIQNNFNGCHRWLSPVDHKWFGEFL